MACGTAVACANTSSLAEIGADAVIYFDPLDVEDISEKISRLLHDDLKRREFCRRGLAQAANYSWRKTAGDTLRMYRQLVSME